MDDNAAFVESTTPTDLAAVEAKLEQAIKERDLWRRQCRSDNERWTKRLLQQIAYTNTWHGKYEVLRIENNKLRNKMYKAVGEEAADA